MSAEGKSDRRPPARWRPPSPDGSGRSRYAHLAAWHRSVSPCPSATVARRLRAVKITFEAFDTTARRGDGKARRAARRDHTPSRGQGGNLAHKDGALQGAMLTRQHVSDASQNWNGETVLPFKTSFCGSGWCRCSAIWRTVL